MAAPHTRPATMIGAPTPDRIPSPRTYSAAGPGAGHGVAVHPGGTTGTQDHRRDGFAFQRKTLTHNYFVVGSYCAASRMPVPSGSKRNSVACWTPRNRASSWATAANTSAGLPRVRPVSPPAEARPASRPGRAGHSWLSSASTARVLARCANVLATSATARNMPITVKFSALVKVKSAGPFRK